MANMSATTAISRIKAAGHDISDEYSNTRCLEFINNSIQQVASLLINAQWPSMIKELTVQEGNTVPANYMKAAGTYPIRMTDGTVHLLDDYTSVRFRYFATPDMITEVDNLPFNHDGINEVIVKGAVLIALNENEYDLTQDKALLDLLQQAIASGMSA